MKFTYYGKTNRHSGNDTYQITEKINGENLSIGNFNNTLVVFQRNNVFVPKDFDQIGYKGLQEFISVNHEFLIDNIPNGCIVSGEWLSNNYYETKEKWLVFAMQKITDELVYTVADYDYIIGTINHCTSVRNYNIDYISECLENLFDNELIGLVPIIESKIKCVPSEFCTGREDYSVLNPKKKLEGYCIYQYKNKILEKIVINKPSSINKKDNFKVKVPKQKPYLYVERVGNTLYCYDGNGLRFITDVNYNTNYEIYDVYFDKTVKNGYVLNAFTHVEADVRPYKRFKTISRMIVRNKVNSCGKQKKN
jgi:hypothetical protein